MAVSAVTIVAMDLITLATDTQGTLTTIYDDIGLTPDEQAAALTQLSEDVCAVFHSRIELTEARRRDLTAEVDALIVTLDNMCHAMEQEAPAQSRGARTLLAFREQLDGERAALQEVRSGAPHRCTWTCVWAIVNTIAPIPLDS